MLQENEYLKLPVHVADWDYFIAMCGLRTYR